ncbi:I78 family peptidase inhibitor [Amylibacter sp.]|jgi:hypothetical protein|nr:hypothetical protein [Amylibacter sp.]MDB9857896.1 I78 family peptidase inhibitor [Amylibacter sp.]
MKHFLPAFALLACVACEPTDPTPAKPTAPAVPDVCNANELQGLVGQKRSAIDKSKFKTSAVRYMFPDTAVTLDHNENRLNIVMSKDGTILRVICA